MILFKGRFAPVKGTHHHKTFVDNHVFGMIEPFVVVVENFNPLLPQKGKSLGIFHIFETRLSLQRAEIENHLHIDPALFCSR